MIGENMGILITLLIGILVFCLLWYLIGMIPFPPPIAQAKWVFYLVLVILAIYWLLKLSGISLP
jgi:xanthine/uracil permease